MTEKPTSPRTERIAEIVAEFNEDRDQTDDRVAVENLARALAWAEAAAATPSLDVPRLRKALREVFISMEYAVGHEPPEATWDAAAATVADEYARLDEGSATPDTLPPCPICGKDDLFVGRDGKPGCPHCEVAVRLPDEGSATPDQGKGEPR